MRYLMIIEQLGIPGHFDEPIQKLFTEQQAIQYQKHIASCVKNSSYPNGYIYSSDIEALEDFKVVHWATEVDVNPCIPEEK